ncbi:MAG TPA: PhoH family protein, partial [Woeseiaceae bacterium]|nr:PhoH family protein [Woeseiaceae bacterium]
PNERKVEILQDATGASTVVRILQNFDLTLVWALVLVAFGFQAWTERPLAFMRGRSLNEAFVILDEAQNTSVAQMKMFLTRIGFGSHAVVTGDITQIDLPPGQQSGLKNAMRILADVEGVSFTCFTPGDVVRHELVQRIVEAYEADGNGHGS